LSTANLVLGTKIWAAVRIWCFANVAHLFTLSVYTIRLLYLYDLHISMEVEYVSHALPTEQQPNIAMKFAQYVV